MRSLELRRVRLRNIRSYRSAEVEFGPGTTLLTGDVGSGKTSVLYSIEMALFGFAEVDAAYLVRHRASEAEVALLLEEPGHRFELVRKFRRKVRKGRDVFEPGESSFAKDGSRARYSATELRQRAIDLLGFPDNPNPRAHSDLWRWAVYVPQERMREILEQEPGPRLETVRKALGLERYRVAADNASVVQAELRSRAQSREAEARPLDRCESELAHWSAERDRLGGLLEALRRRESESRTALAAADRELREAETALHGGESAAREAEELEEQVGRLSTSLAELEGRVSRLDVEQHDLAAEAANLEARAAGADAARQHLREVEERRGRLREEVERLEARRREFEVASAERAVLASRRKEAEESVAAALTARSEENGRFEASLTEGPAREPPPPTPRTVETIEADLKRLRADLGESDRALAKDEATLGDLDELLGRGVCPRCGQAVTPGGFRGHREELAKAVAGRRGERDRLREEIVAREEERRSRERYERAHLRWVEAERQRRLAREALARAEERFVEARRTLDASRAAEAEAGRRTEALRPVAEELERRRQELGAAERERDAALSAQEELLRAAERARGRRENARSIAELAGRLREDVGARRAELARHTERLTEVRRGLVGLAGLREALRERERRRDLTRATLEGAVGELHRAAAELEQARVRVQEAERGRAERSRLLDDATRLRGLGDWMVGPLREALMQLERRLLARAQAAFDRDLTRFFSVLVEDAGLVARCDASFAPFVEIDGEWTPAEALSGGERTALALAYRLALGKVVRDAGRLRLATLILDEPTDGFSPEQVLRMGELLEELAIPQVILVSHEEELAAVADRVLRVRKAAGLSEVVADRPAPAGAPAAQPPEGPGRSKGQRGSRPRGRSLDVLPPVA